VALAPLYRAISACVDDDDYFELVLRNAWHISGGEGWCQNTTCTRVLVLHQDGHQVRRLAGPHCLSCTPAWCDSHPDRQATRSLPWAQFGQPALSDNTRRG
jgi:hypothetical protein